MANITEDKPDPEAQARRIQLMMKQLKSENQNVRETAIRKLDAAFDKLHPDDFEIRVRGADDGDRQRLLRAYDAIERNRKYYDEMKAQLQNRDERLREAIGKIGELETKLKAQRKRGKPTDRVEHDDARVDFRANLSDKNLSLPLDEIGKRAKLYVERTDRAKHNAVANYELPLGELVEALKQHWLNTYCMGDSKRAKRNSNAPTQWDFIRQQMSIEDKKKERWASKCHSAYLIVAGDSWTEIEPHFSGNGVQGIIDAQKRYQDHLAGNPPKRSPVRKAELLYEYVLAGEVENARQVAEEMAAAAEKRNQRKERKAE